MVNLQGKTILVTGSAGFIGFHVAKRLLEEGVYVIGFDNFNEYYGKDLKEARNKILESHQNFTGYRADLTCIDDIRHVMQEHPIDQICHLAAQAGIRYSMENPEVYIQSNVVGFSNLIEEARKFNIKDFVYTSSSSVYGANTKVPFSEDDVVDSLVSLYAVTKKTNELIAHNYHHLFGMNCTGLRLFTVYGPYNRPDMGMFLFVKNIAEGIPVTLFNQGNMKRDFTYIDDAVEGIILSLKKRHPWEIINIGGGNPVGLEYIIDCIEKSTGKTAIRKYAEIQPGEMVDTVADISRAKQKLGYEPRVSLEDGIDRLVEWYMVYSLYRD